MKYLKIWQLLSQVIGKFRSKLWKNRKSKAVMTLCRMVGVTKAWIATRRLKYKATLTNILEANVTKNILMRLMYQYKRKIIFIQRTVKRLLVENRLTWPYRLLLWNRLESKINLRKKEKAITRPKIQIASKKERRSVRERGFSRIIAPQEVKYFFIKNWFKEKIKEHMKSLENYRTNVKNMIGDYKKLLYRKLFSSVHQNITVEELVLPAKPEMRYDLSEGEMRKLIVSAYEQLDKWESIIFDSNTKRKYFMGQVSRFHNRKSIIKQQYNLE